MARVLCAKCGAKANIQHTQYGVRTSHCDLWAWGDAPLVDRETHEARKAAHAAFDPLWKGGKMSRGEAYRLLREKLGLTAGECHMKVMDAATAGRVPQAVREIQQENDVDVIE